MNIILENDLEFPWIDNNINIEPLINFCDINNIPFINWQINAIDDLWISDNVFSRTYSSIWNRSNRWTELPRYIFFYINWIHNIFKTNLAVDIYLENSLLKNKNTAPEDNQLVDLYKIVSENIMKKSEIIEDIVKYWNLKYDFYKLSETVFIWTFYFWNEL